MSVTTLAAWNAWEAAERAWRENDPAAAWEQLTALAVLDPAFSRARYLSARLSLTDGAFCRAVDLFTDFLDRAETEIAAPDPDRELKPLIIEARRLLALTLARVNDPDAPAQLWRAIKDTADPNLRLRLVSEICRRTEPLADRQQNRRARAVYRHLLSHTTGYHRYDPDPDGKIRVGFLAADYAAPARLALLEILRELPPAEFTVKFYRYAAPPLDDAPNAAAPLPDDLPVTELTDHPQTSAAVIYRDGTDILVCLDGHGLASPLPILAYRPAPVQLTADGVVGPVSLTGVDYRLSDSAADGGPDPLFEETEPDDPMYGEPSAPTVDDDGYVHGDNRMNALAAKSAAAAAAANSVSGLSGAYAAAAQKYSGYRPRKIHLSFHLAEIDQMADILDDDGPSAAHLANTLADRDEEWTSGIGRGKKVKSALTLQHFGRRRPKPADEPAFIKHSPADEAVLALPLARAEIAGRFTDSRPVNRDTVEILAVTPFDKLTDDTAALWAEFLRDRPYCRLTVVHPLTDASDAARFVRHRLIAAGIAETQLILICAMDGPRAVITPHTYDVAVDDGTADRSTVLRAVSAGLPVITLAEAFDRRQAAAILETLWLEEFVVADRGELPELMDCLIMAKELRRDLVRKLPAALKNSALADGQKLLNAWTDGLELVWERYGGQVPGKKKTSAAETENAAASPVGFFRRWLNKIFGKNGNS